MNEEQNKSQVALAEEKILNFWKEQNIFQKSLQKDSPQGEFVFFDGPPYATGLPHYGHLLPGTMKDVIPRYKTMQGFYVPRQWGWDCHGLPIENMIQKELNLPTKQDIVDYGIEKFNQAARDSVLRYEKDWKEYIPRVGRFVDMENPYKTMDPEYMESVWTVFKNLEEKGLVYKSYKSMMVSPPLETVLSNQEVNMGGYKDITDISVYANFTLTSGPHKGANMVAWTTTPWTLPGNVLLAVGEEIEYVVIDSELNSITTEIENNSEKKTITKKGKYIVAKNLIKNLDELFVCLKKYDKWINSEITKEEDLFDGELIIKGKDLINSTYEPVFPIYKNHTNAFRVVAGDFVTTEDGTGIVHIAPAFGQDDLTLGQKEKVEPIHHVKMDGHFVPEVENFLVEAGYDVKGWAVRNTVDHQHIDIEIVKYLARNGKLFEKKKYVHSYPVCWRTDCPLINYATESWFVNVQKIKDKLIKNNQKTSWVPNHIKDGRFGKWLEEVRDWSVSRARFWGTPLPIWQAEDGENLFIGSVEDLKKYTKKSGNKYFAMRHGEAESNVKEIFVTKVGTQDGLTERGVSQVKASAESLKNKKIDIIFVSPFQRAQETMRIVKETLGLSDEQVITDERLSEINVGDLDGQSYETHHAHTGVGGSAGEQTGGGESLFNMRQRTGDFMYDIEAKYANKNILILSHRSTLWMLFASALGTLQNKTSEFVPFDNAEVRELAFVSLPHNQNYELDLHRPYIDDVVLEKDGKQFSRISDVFDVWFDSGSMPYATREIKKNFFGKVSGIPADFVAEGQDQTRGWFYVMMVLASAQFDQPAFKNVLVNGLVLAEDGKKMSKRLKNYPDLNVMIDSAGADALRLFLMASPAVHAEDVNFSEKSVNEIQSKVMGRLRNSATFYEMYQAGESALAKSPNVLDQWIVARLHETNKAVSEGLDEYLIDKGARPLFDFVDDLSTWYVRRSRDRFKNGDEDGQQALATTRFVLKEFAKLSAPFIPFVAEEVYQKVKEVGDPESVHLCNWPKAGTVDIQVLEQMKKTRELASLGLEARQKAGIKVRQPLQELRIKSQELRGEYIEIIKDEVNVKSVVFDETISQEVVLDTVITPELKLEGQYRELLRAIQDLRKQNNLSTKETITLSISEDAQQLVRKFEADLVRLTQIEKIVFEETQGQEVDLEDFSVVISITKN